MIRGLNLPGTPRVTSACRRRRLLPLTLEESSEINGSSISMCFVNICNAELRDLWIENYIREDASWLLDEEGLLWYMHVTFGVQRAVHRDTFL